ncbi:hypothetical protein H5410_007120 [Solanum commersonii]|uniref:Uncharacterized protein n=1 Tax=Solanum commersonii TaxID=4109 RepID=A0A9J6AB20_SOLCO|nr:hypothetical protein H5410_007120 [Solanum commersonii]
MQQPQSSTNIDSSTHQQQQIYSTRVTNKDSPNSHQLGPSQVPTPPKQDMRLRGKETLARFKDRLLTKEEERVVLLLLDRSKK